MRNALLSSLLAGASVAALSVLSGCSGGSGSDSASVRIRCIGGEEFCLISCDLGCTQTGCAISEIAENQKLHFKFSDAVDPASVNGASLSIRTATGVAPDGHYVVVENEVSFEPSVRTVNGVSTFGFQRNESYIVTIAGGNSAAIGIRNLSGDRLAHELTCTVRASLGIQDEDQQPPTATLVAPTDTTAIPLDPTIVLRFSELIDTTPLQSPLSSSSPIQVVLRSTLPSGACDLDAEGIVLTGLPQLSTELVGVHEVTVVTYRPTVTLPGLSCVTVYVTSDLRDLSGRAAVPAQFQMFTQAGVSLDILITEPFANSAKQEELVSGGIWNNGARPALVGGDGRHGSFAPSFGTSQGAGVFVWNLDPPGITIPAGNTPSGQSFTVTDGRFFFTDFVLAAGTTLKFTGSVAPQIFVRGRCEIRGVLDCSGADLLPATVPSSGPLVNLRASQFNAKGTPAAVLTVGQLGGFGGAGGGNGGSGGSECNGTAGPLPGGACDGQSGQTVKVQASHAYAGQTGGTGGAGSPLVPANGLTASASTPFITASVPFRRDYSRGGGGGGFMLAGGSPALPTIAPGTLTQPAAGPVVNGGVLFALLPFPAVPPPGYQSLNHFLVGGSGGGGGGAHNFSTSTLLDTAAGTTFVSGHAGTGGGGAIALRAGGDLTLFAPVGGTPPVPSGAILVRGGRGVVINGDNLVTTTQDIDFGVSSPGGGGSGGSVLLQSSRTVTVNGLIDASGDPGSRTQSVSTALAPTQINVVSQGGAGSSGFYRLEGGTDVVFSGTIGTTPAYDPLNNRGPLNDRDAASGDLSKWYGTNLVFPPTWLRYELDVDTNGDGTVDVTFTDSGLAGTQKANDPAGPVVIQFQGAKIDQDGVTPIPGTIRPWREGIGIGGGPGIQQDSATGFRFTMTYNRAAFPDQVIRALRVYART